MRFFKEQRQNKCRITYGKLKMPYYFNFRVEFCQILTEVQFRFVICPIKLQNFKAEINLNWVNIACDMFGKRKDFSCLTACVVWKVSFQFSVEPSESIATERKEKNLEQWSASE
jgi:hypothetical protein